MGKVGRRRVGEGVGLEWMLCRVVGMGLEWDLMCLGKGIVGKGGKGRKDRDVGKGQKIGGVGLGLGKASVDDGWDRGWWVGGLGWKGRVG